VAISFPGAPMRAPRSDQVQPVLAVGSPTGASQSTFAGRFTVYRLGGRMAAPYLCGRGWSRGACVGGWSVGVSESGLNWVLEPLGFGDMMWWGSQRHGRGAAESIYAGSPSPDRGWDSGAVLDQAAFGASSVDVRTVTTHVCGQGFRWVARHRLLGRRARGGPDGPVSGQPTEQLVRRRVVV